MRNMVTKTIQELLVDTKQMIQNTPSVWKIFTDADKIKFDRVTINWNKQKTYRVMGVYHRNTNSIKITITLKDVPDFVSQQVIWHELFHIHFNGHGRLFSIYEEAYPKFKEAKKFIMEEANKIYHQKHQQKGGHTVNPIIKTHPSSPISVMEQLISQLGHKNTQPKPIITQPKPVIVESVLSALEICKKICQK